MRLARLASLASLVVALAAGPLAAVEAPVTVTFAHPETYPDLRLSCVSRDADARSLMAEIEAFLVATGAPLVPAGQRLEITITSIDMAGGEGPPRRHPAAARLELPGQRGAGVLPRSPALREGPARGVAAGRARSRDPLVRARPRRG